MIVFFSHCTFRQGSIPRIVHIIIVKNHAVGITASFENCKYYNSGFLLLSACFFG